MAIDIDKMQEQLCRALCRNVRIEPHGKFFAIDTPFYFPDGDAYQVYLEENKDGSLRLSDKSNLMMRLSYEVDTESLYKGSRDVIRRRILSETGMQEQKGEIFLNTPPDKLSEAIFAFGRGLTRIHDLLLLSRSRVTSVFYDDLWSALCGILGENKIQRDYQVKEIKGQDLYPVDFYFDGKGSRPVYLFGILNSDKARLVTISLEYFHRNGVDFDSLLVFQDQENMPRKDLARLLNVGGESVASLDAQADLQRKVTVKAA